MLTVGAPSAEQLAALERRSALVESDWYLNRAIEKTFIGLGRRANLELHGARAARDEAYWFRAGWKKLGTYLRTRPDGTATERGLVPDPPPHGTPEMMEIERVESEADYLAWTETLRPMYLAAMKVLALSYEADEAKDDAAWADAIAAAAANPLVHPEIGRALAAMLPPSEDDVATPDGAAEVVAAVG